MSFKASEMTVRRIFTEELERRGVSVSPERTFRTPHRVLRPDAVAENGGVYVIETKMGAESKLLDDVTKLHEYFKSPSHGLRGAFALLLPEELRRSLPDDRLRELARNPELTYVAIGLFQDERPNQRYQGSLSRVSSWMAGQILRPPVAIEPDTPFVIDLVTQAVDYLRDSVRPLRESELEDIFGGRSVFENILEYEEGQYPLDEMRLATTYLLLNQLLFYQVLSSNDPGTFPPIDEDSLERPRDLAKHFVQVLDVDYAATFGFDVASRLSDQTLPAIKKVVAAVKAIGPEKIRHDILGKVFHNLIPYKVRKAVAAYYTNNEAATLLASLSIDSPDAKVYDLACGSGTLLVSSYHRKRELAESSEGEFTSGDHRRYAEEDLTGIDIMPFAAHLAAVHLSLQAPVYQTQRVRIAVWDSTELAPGQVIPAIRKELREAYRRPTLQDFEGGDVRWEETAYVKKGTVTLDRVGGEDIPLDEADVVIMNPPFTRHERLPSDYKKALHDRLGEYEDTFHGQMGLYGYFMLLADRFCRDAGRVALVLPATTLRLRSMENLRRYFLEGYEWEYLITTTQRAAFSESARFREVLLVAKKVQPTAKSQCLVINLEEMPRTTDEAFSMGREIGTLRANVSEGESFEGTRFKGISISQSELQDNVHNLWKLVPGASAGSQELWDEIRNQAGSALVELSKYVKDHGGKIIRGIQVWKGDDIYSPEMFVLREEERALKSYDAWFSKALSEGSVRAHNRQTQNTISIPLAATEPGLRRMSGIDCINITGREDFIVTDRFDDFDGFYAGDVTRIRLRKWKKYVRNRLCNLAVGGRYDIGAPGTQVLTFFSEREFAPTQMLWCIRKIPIEDAKILSLWLNSTPNILQLMQEKKETRGSFVQILGYVLKKLRAIDPGQLPDDRREELLDVFDRVGDAKFPSILDQLSEEFEPRLAIDIAVLESLGFDRPRTLEILNRLYSHLYDEIEKLKTLMKG